jgi:hypothetical protein
MLLAATAGSAVGLLMGLCSFGEDARQVKIANGFGLWEPDHAAAGFTDSD